MEKQVIMKIEATTIGHYKKKDITSILFGGYAFVIEDKTLCFDFDATSATIEETDDNLKIFFETGRGLLFDDYDVSEDYKEEYEEFGITKDQITAELLASVDRIDELWYEILNNDEEEVEIWINSIVFVDENGKEFEVDQKVIAHFNGELE